MQEFFRSTDFRNANAGNKKTKPNSSGNFGQSFSTRSSHIKAIERDHLKKIGTREANTPVVKQGSISPIRKLK